VIYTVGDSHSNGISNYGKRKGFIAKGKDGSPSTAKMHLDAINSIPEGSDVVISLGANDLAGGRKISSIVGSVTSVIAAAQKRRLNVTYLLPTLPASNKPYDPRRVELREALKMAVKVPIIDLGQASTTDKLGVHLDPAGYAQMAGKVSQSFKSSTSVSTTTSTSNLPTENLNNVPENLQNFIQNSSDTLTNVIKDLNQKSQGNSEAEKKTTLAGMLISQLSTQLKALDEMTGGKLGASSGEVSEALRYLEDEFNQGTSIFDLSTKTAVHKTETTVNTPPNIQKTNQNILNAILKRHYT
jgi:lysophospholipase L1-like esterase